jgi:hypothetical protein
MDDWDKALVLLGFLGFFGFLGFIAYLAYIKPQTQSAAATYIPVSEIEAAREMVRGVRKYG